MNARRLLWIALGGLVLGIAGVAWDRAWHSRHAGEALVGATEVVEAHWLMIVGVAIIFGALLMAVRSVRDPRSAAVSTWVAFTGSVFMVVGFAWDSARHIQGTESPTAHMMIYGGLVLVIAGLAAALVVSRGSRTIPTA